MKTSLLALLGSFLLFLASIAAAPVPVINEGVPCSDASLCNASVSGLSNMGGGAGELKIRTAGGQLLGTIAFAALYTMEDSSCTCERPEPTEPEVCLPGGSCEFGEVIWILQNHSANDAWEVTWDDCNGSVYDFDSAPSIYIDGNNQGSGTGGNFVHSQSGATTGPGATAAIASCDCFLRMTFKHRQTGRTGSVTFNCGLCNGTCVTTE